MNNSTAPAAVTLIKQIETRQAELGVTNKHLCDALGFDREIVLTLIMQGTMKMPINKLPALAQVLQLDAAELLQTAIPELSPGLLEIIKEVVSPLHLTDSEVNLIQHVRTLSGDRVGVPIVFDGRGVIALVAA